MSWVAGHNFGLNGTCTLDICRKRLSDIAFAAYDPAWIGMGDIAHTGTLTLNEQTQIRSELDRVFGAVMEGAKV